MKVRILTNLGTNDFPETPFLDGEEVEVSDQLAAQLFSMKLAVDITPAPEPEKTKPAAEPAPAVHKTKATSK